MPLTVARSACAVKTLIVVVILFCLFVVGFVCLLLVLFLCCWFLLCFLFKFLRERKAIGN